MSKQMCILGAGLAALVGACIGGVAGSRHWSLTKTLPTDPSPLFFEAEKVIRAWYRYWYRGDLKDGQPSELVVDKNELKRLHGNRWLVKGYCIGTDKAGREFRFTWALTIRLLAGYLVRGVRIERGERIYQQAAVDNAGEKAIRTIAVRCSGCKGMFRAPAEAAGKRVECPKCATVIQVGNWGRSLSSE